MAFVRNILEFMEDVTSSLNKHKYVDVVFLDFQKAFDKVPHQHLLLKLKQGGVIEITPPWLKCMGISGYCLGSSIGFVTLGNRGMVVSGCASSWQEVTSGVPQLGSVLGPLLFVAFINDIDADILCRAKKVADDTNLYSEVSSKGEKFQMDLDKIFSWSQEWQMLFNIDKCR